MSEVLGAVGGAIIRMKASRTGVFSNLEPFNENDCARCPHRLEAPEEGVFCKALYKDHQVKCRCHNVIKGAPND